MEWTNAAMLADVSVRAGDIRRAIVPPPADKTIAPIAGAAKRLQSSTTRRKAEKTEKKRKSHHGGCPDTSHRSIGLSGLLYALEHALICRIGLIPGDGIGREVIPVGHSIRWESEGIEGYMANDTTDMDRPDVGF